MGRVKTLLTKRLSFETYDRYKNRLSEDFEENKKLVDEVMPGGSKKVRNTVAGYVTRLMKRKEEY
ncbi:30S ribosomal protein S17e [Candidatus Woesearchaeota archaeon]|nr:30S ribosomal protein S17e [Candidatus Woesearchaeota archaeon]